MTPANPSSGLQRQLVILGMLVLVVASLYFARAVLIPVALAVLLTFVLTPAVSHLQRRGLRRSLAVGVVVVLAFAALALVGWVVLLQLRALAEDLPNHQATILKKLSDLQPDQGGAVGKLSHMVEEIGGEVKRMTRKTNPEGREPIPVTIEEPGGWAKLPEVLAPLVEPLASALLVVVLVIFMLIKREDLRNRLIRLLGHGRLTVTTRALDEAGQRISRYLVMLVLVNACFGLAVAVGLLVLRVPYAFLWGFLAACLRFIPYIGPWLGLSLPLTLSLITSDGWWRPVALFGLFVALEIFISQVIEPWLYGRSIGVSEVAMLVAAAFWAWLWGPIGLILAPPLTVILVVLGKYVPQLEFFDVLMGDEEALGPETRYYQRLLARDQDEAAELVEEYLQTNPWEKVYDQLFLPVLRMARRDREQDDLSAEDQEYVQDVTREIMDDLVAAQRQISQIAAEPVGPAARAEPEGRPAVLVLGCPARDAGDKLALHMFEQLLGPARCRLEVLSAKTLAAELLERVGRDHPAAVCIAALPPGGLTHTRYLCKRLRAHFPGLKVLVGRWGG
ncbi:MAG TPA: AI-2E family transporter, partial [Gemmataceae bacterium]|nr:AI-2E family transporter [Gemmataceae bacterium]